MLKFLNFSLKFVIIFSTTLIFFIFSTLWYFSVGLPDYKRLSNYQPPISSRVYSEDRKLIAEYALEKRLFIPYEAIPSKIINDEICLEIKIISILSSVIFEIEKILKKYQIQVINYLEKGYVNDFFHDEGLDISHKANKLLQGLNQNEVKITLNSTKKQGFFEKFFQLFS